MNINIKIKKDSKNAAYRRTFRLCAAVLGGVYYSFLEVLWRGYTHWTMIFAGAAALAFMYFIFTAGTLKSYFLKCFVSAAGVCAIEFFMGCIVNLWLGWEVWDYSEMPFNLLGQICPVFFAVWFALSIPGSFLCRAVKRIEDDIFTAGLNTERRSE